MGKCKGGGGGERDVELKLLGRRGAETALLMASSVEKEYRNAFE